MTTQPLLLGLYQHVVSLAASTCLTHAFRRAFEDDVLLFQVCPHRGIYLRMKKKYITSIKTAFTTLCLCYKRNQTI